MTKNRILAVNERDALKNVYYLTPRLKLVQTLSMDHWQIPKFEKLRSC